MSEHGKRFPSNSRNGTRVIPYAHILNHEAWSAIENPEKKTTGRKPVRKPTRRQGTAKGKWEKIGLYCEGCGQSWTYRQKEIFQENDVEYEI